MTVTTRVLRIDSWVSEARPSDTHGPDPQLMLHQASGIRKRAYLSAARPWAAMGGITVVSAKLRVVLARDAPGAITLKARRITSAWTEGKVKWSAQPTVVGADDASVSVGAGATAGTVVEFDVLAAMQAVADGSPYFGFRIEADPGVTAGPLRIGSSEHSNENRRPVLVVDWTSPPDQPTDLIPSGARFVSVTKPTVSWGFGDVLDPGAYQSAFQVQVDDVDTFAAPDYDSTQIASGASQLALSATAYAGLPTNGAIRYWRPKVWDDSGRASAFADAAQVRYAPLGVVAVTGPAATTQQVRPVVTWTFTPPATPLGEPAPVQEAWRARIEQLVAGVWVTIADSGLTTGTELTWTSPIPLPSLTASYRARVEVADSLAREAIVGAPALASGTRTFAYSAGGAVGNPAGLTATIIDGYAVRLNWTRATQPDHWALECDGAILEDDIDPTPTGTAYAWTWYGALPRKAHSLVLHAVEVVGGAFVLSTGTAVAAQTSPRGIWLVDPLTGEQVCIAGKDELTAGIGETASVFPRLGDRAPVLVTEMVRGYEGGVSGIFATWDQCASPRAAKDLLMDLRSRALLRVVLGDLNLPVAVYGLAANPTPATGDEKFSVAFSFVQIGEFDR